MIDKYPNFLPEWTKALENLHNQRERFLHFWTKSVDHGDKDDINRIIKSESYYKLDWGSGEKCFTGEAFFFEHAPTCTCAECKTMTYDSFDNIESLEKFYTYKVNLAHHLQLTHPDVWSKWEDRL